MAGQLFGERATSCDSSDTSTSKKNKQVSIAMFEKWQQQFDGEYQSLLWLRYTKNDAKIARFNSVV